MFNLQRLGRIGLTTGFCYWINAYFGYAEDTLKAKKYREAARVDDLTHIDFFPSYQLELLEVLTHLTYGCG